MLDERPDHADSREEVKGQGQNHSDTTSASSVPMMADSFSGRRPSPAQLTHKPTFVGLTPLASSKARTARSSARASSMRVNGAISSVTA
jgi:hypothetical protein